MRSFLIPLLLLALHGALAAETITRGPYLQQATPTSVVVCWRTDIASIGRVRYGTAEGTLDRTAVEPAPVTDHRVTLTGLTAGASYWYDVGTPTTVLAGGPTYAFRATPTGNDAVVRVWALGDCGTRSKGQRAVRDAFYRWNGGSTRVDVALLLGDNAYAKGTDHEHQGAIFDMYPESLRQCVFWSTIGNHDIPDNKKLDESVIPYFSIFTNPTKGEAGGVASGTEKYYSFDHGPIHFVCLDSLMSKRTADGAQATWLKADLAATTKPWLVAFFHYPPYSKGSHDSDREKPLAAMREVYVPILEAHGVDLVLTGHSHSYERSYLLDGHYGTSDTLTPAMKKDAGNGRVDGDGAYTKAPGPRQGTVYVVSGSAGKTSSGTLDHPVMVVSLKELASFAFEVSGNRLDATMIRSDGTIRDTFTMIKGAPATKTGPTPMAPRAP